MSETSKKSDKAEDKVPEGMKKGSDVSNVPKEFLQAYNYAIMKAREANPGKAFTLDGFHAMLDKWSKETEAKIEAYLKKGEAAAKESGDTFVWGTRTAKEHKLRVTTVAEAKQQLAQMNLKDGDNLVWGTRLTRGQKKDFEATLTSMADGDAIVWGN